MAKGKKVFVNKGMNFKILKELGGEIQNPRKYTLAITGFILATDFNRRGKVLEIAIETEDFQQYIVTPNQKGKELFELLYSKVTVFGVITGEDVHGNPIIKINDYEVVDRIQFIKE